jgi:DNA-binding winged helix-turn-helix (wHTH) protein
MNLERKVGRQRIGEWEFSTASGELRRRGEVRRLEPRAAKALDLLLAADGELVSQEQLIAEVWGGRSLSENSVAVVIGQLRKALGDDAREPTLIETIPKRGYRLQLKPVEDVLAKRRKTGPVAVAILAAILLGVWLYSIWPGGASPVTVAVEDVANDTGNSAYAPLARATSELTVTEFGGAGFAVRRSGPADLKLDSKLVMWEGDPWLGVTATDQAGVVRWSMMAKATEGKVPPAVKFAAEDMARKFPPKAGAARLAKPASGR